MELGKDACCAIAVLENVTPSRWDSVEMPQRLQSCCDAKEGAFLKLHPRRDQVSKVNNQREVELGKVVCITSFACCVLLSLLMMHTP